MKIYINKFYEAENLHVLACQAIYMQSTVAFFLYRVYMHLSSLLYCMRSAETAYCCRDYYTLMAFGSACLQVLACICIATQLILCEHARYLVCGIPLYVYQRHLAHNALYKTHKSVLLSTILAAFGMPCSQLMLPYNLTAWSCSRTPSYFGWSRRLECLISQLITQETPFLFIRKTVRYTLLVHIAAAVT